MVNVLLGNIGVEVLALNEAQEKFIHDLNMGPCNFKNRLVLLWIKSLSLWVHGRRNGPKQVLAEHFHDARVHGFLDDVAIVGNVVQQFVQSQALYLL